MAATMALASGAPDLSEVARRPDKEGIAGQVDVVIRIGIAALTQAPTYIASYSWIKPSMQAVARVLLGAVNPSGKLPVRIPASSGPTLTLYPFGFGIGY